jgi:hypothetical protein
MMSNVIANITDADLPGLFRSADGSAGESQRRYLWLVKADLALIVLSAIASSWAISSPKLRMALAIIGAILFLSGMALTAFVYQTQYDKRWFVARAMAESAKTVSWRYMACAEPYLRSLTEENVDALFCKELEGILREHRAVGAALGGAAASAEQITGRMRGVRRADLETRKAVYLHDRIQNQRKWYGDRAYDNAMSSGQWLAAIAVSQLCGAIAAVLLVVRPEFEFNLPSVLAALAAVLLAWLQLNRHQELAHAYGVAAHELGLIEARLPHVNTEDGFSHFVADSENAISREHTMWMARRDTISA